MTVRQPTESNGHMCGWYVERMPMRRAFDYWFHGDRTVLFRLNPNGYVVALPRVEVQWSLKALDLLKNCRDYLDLRHLEGELVRRKEEPQLFPWLPLLNGNEGEVDLVLENVYLMGTGRVNSIHDLLLEELDFMPPDDPEAYFKDPGEEHLASEAEAAILRAKTELFYQTKFDLMTCPLFRDATGRHLLWTDFCKETSLWIPTEIADRAGTRWGAFDTDRSVPEYSFRDPSLLQDSFAEFGVQMIEANDEFRALSTFKSN